MTAALATGRPATAGEAATAAVSGQVALPGGKGAQSAVVWLEATGLHAPPAPGAVMDQRNKMFDPHILVVSPGTRIRFPNNDTVFHNVFAYFEAKRFDLGMYPRGTSKTQVFDKPGIVAVLCNVHPRMSSFIVILDSPYRTQAGQNGAFSLRGVPPGTYTLHGWHESGATASALCVVKSGGQTVSPLRLQLERR